MDTDMEGGKEGAAPPPQVGTPGLPAPHDLVSEYACPLCPADFPTLNRATRHIRRVHPEMSRDDYLIWRARATGKPACLRCGAPVRWRTARYCSLRCAGEAQRSRPLEVACAHCGAIFKRAHVRARYCSQRCASAARSVRPLMVACDHCGRIFKREGTAQRYCSRRCAADAQRVRRSEAVCARCGTTFRPSRATQRYCSQRCAAEAWRARRSEVSPRREQPQRARPVIKPDEVRLARLADSPQPVPAVVINVLIGKDGQRRYPIVPLREPRRLIVVTDAAWADSQRPRG
jgi:endogenous inhibitor of DNA gyrase (YacG/DUF329 family)